MIKKKDVITMRIPFPEVDSELARYSHMYICLEHQHPKKFLKCQSAYDYLKDIKVPPYKFIEVAPDMRHNPFRKPTLIDCDKSFAVDHDIVINEKSLTTKRRDVSDELFAKLEKKIKHNDFTEIVLEAEKVAQINDKIKLVGGL